MIKEFKQFVMRGNVLDMAVGIIIGASFGSIVKSMVDDVIMPPIGLLLGRVDFSNLYLVLKEGAAAGPYPSLLEAKKAGAVTINYGMFVNTLISFLIVAFCVFLLIKAFNRIKTGMVQAETPPPPPATKDCPYCLSAINPKATRCPNCTSALE